MQPFNNPLEEKEARELVGEFAEEHDEAVIREAFAEELRSWANAKSPNFVPALARRAARQRLQLQAQSRRPERDAISKDAPEVLYVCVHNAGRSQMAAALTAHLSGGRVSVRSAGSEPAGAVNPAVVQALAELGLNIAQEFPKPLTEDAVQGADVVITMGCGDACPIYPGKRYLDWQVDDPAGQSIETVRRIREDIAGRVQGLLAELGITPRGVSIS